MKMLVLCLLEGSVMVRNNISEFIHKYTNENELAAICTMQILHQLVYTLPTST